MDKKKERKKRAAAAAVAATASVGVILGSAFDSPEELMQPEDAPAAVDYVLSENDGDDDGAAAAEEDEERRRAPGARVRAAVWRLPAAVRALVGVPLWCVGFLLLTAFSTLWSGILSPLGGHILGWAAVAAALLAAFAIATKAVFPDLPLKKILTRKNFLRLFLGTAALAAADGVLPLIWDGYEKGRGVLRAAATALLLAAVTILFIRREKKRREKAAEREKEKPLSAEEAQKEALRRAREMVDAVK